MRYRVNWSETVGYYCYVEADSPEEAREKFDSHEWSSDSDYDGECEIHTESIGVTEDP